MATGAVGPYNAAEEAVSIAVITTFNDVGLSNLSVMVGTGIAAHRQLEIRERIVQCVQAFIEEGFIAPAVASTYRVATLAIDNGKAAVVVADKILTDIPDEGNVSVVYGDLFNGVPASTLNLKTTAKILTNALLKLGLSAT